jgi:hypothetical protein
VKHLLEFLRRLSDDSSEKGPHHELRSFGTQRRGEHDQALVGLCLGRLWGQLSAAREHHAWYSPSFWERGRRGEAERTRLSRAP